MPDAVFVTLVVAGVAVAMAGLDLLALRVRRRGTAGPAIGAAMAAYDEAMHSTAHDAYVEMQADAERMTPAPTPDKR